jgi:hypothetical protein
MRSIRLRTAITALALLFLLALNALAAKSVQDLLPAKNAVKGWSITPSSLQYGKGDDLTIIYDGGYELYTKSGVVDAARQLYQRGSDYVEVTVHTMKDAKAASRFLAYWQKQNKVKSLSRTKASSYFTTTEPNTAVYFTTGKYFTTVNAFYKSGKAKADAVAFMGAIERNISKH